MLHPFNLLRRIVLAMLLLPVVAVAEPGAGEAALPEALAAYVATMEGQGFSGSVLIAEGGRIVHRSVHGVADPRSGDKVSHETRFNLASAGKMFTAVAVLQLVEEGKLDLDAPIGTYLPDWPVASVREQVTARQLLMHTSGLGSYWGPAFDSRRASLETLDDYRPLLATEPAFAPGTAWQYSNSGFMLLGLLVEATSGMSFYDYVQRHVFDRAGMRDSGYYAMDGRAENTAIPHRAGSGAGLVERLPMPEPRGGAAGGGYSTPDDLLRFHKALVGGRLLGAEGRALLFGGVTLPAGTRAPPHGLGVLRYAAGETVVYGHPGGAPGVGVDFRAEAADGWVAIVMSNSDEPRASAVLAGLLDLVARHGGTDLRMAGGMRPR